MKEKKNTGRSRKILRAIVIGLLLLSALLLILERNLETVILDLAHARAGAIAVTYMNEAVREVMQGSVAYGDMMEVKTDDQGRVTLIRANAARMNELASATALSAQEKLESAEAQSVDVPLGAALGIPFFSAMGPKIQVRILCLLRKDR